MVSDQIRFATSVDIDHILLGINHTRQSHQRLRDALEALSPTGKIFLYNLPTFHPVNREFILQCFRDERIAGIKDSSGDTEFFRWLLSLKKERPDFQVFHGNEELYGALSASEFTDVDGLVAGNANVHPALLHAYTKNPYHKVHQHGRQELHMSIV